VSLTPNGALRPDFGMDDMSPFSLEEERASRRSLRWGKSKPATSRRGGASPPWLWRDRRDGRSSRPKV